MSPEPVSLDGRKALVTGAASGIGAATARRLAALGAEVVLADVDTEGAERVAEEVGGTVWTVDLDDTAALDGLHLDCDILVNNAGIQRVAPIEELPPETFRQILRIMLEAPFLLIRSALPHMYERGWGRVVNISSVHGVRASPFKSAYVTAKHGLEGLSKVTALEGAAHGVTSVCVDPGYVRTPLVERQMTDLAAAHGIPEEEVLRTIMLTEPAVKRLVEADEVASLVAWLVGPDAAMATGSSYALDGGWSAH